MEDLEGSVEVKVFCTITIKVKVYRLIVLVFWMLSNNDVIVFILEYPMAYNSEFESRAFW